MFNIIYHHRVVHDDIPKLSGEWKERIRLMIEGRLMTCPDLYGKPLRRSLRGYRKFRVGDYRIIYRIDKNIVKILIIQHRSTVYAQIKKRI